MSQETTKEFITENQIIERIFSLRCQNVMLDSDLAEMYGVDTKVLNQAVKRNILRFPEDFMFQPDFPGTGTSKVTFCDLRCSGPWQVSQVPAKSFYETRCGHAIEHSQIRDRYPGKYSNYSGL